jgi:Cu(I)/Ag(I) efflux system membrane fusion protein/cobalt-zinc-cadmium efflux system membrane fusion protein
MKTRTYQFALGSAIIICILLATALAYVLLHGKLLVPQTASEDTVVARGPQSSAPAMPSGAAAPSAAEPALTPIQLSPQRLQQIGVTTASVGFKNVTQDLRAPGSVDIDEQTLSYVQTRFTGWIQNVSANATYQYVRKGQRLFTVYSPDLVSSEQELLLAKQNQKAFSLDMHGTASRESGWLLQAAEQRLQQFGLSAQEIADVEQSGKAPHEITVYSPASGYITERNALPNAYVQPDTKLYTIADLSTVWVYANVSQGDVGRLKPGDPGQVTVDAYPRSTAASIRYCLRLIWPRAPCVCALSSATPA